MYYPLSLRSSFHFFSPEADRKLTTPSCKECTAKAITHRIGNIRNKSGGPASAAAPPSTPNNGGGGGGGPGIKSKAKKAVADAGD
ncbi:MAG: hypothetical protein L6R35_007402, partial [Caloplaca aegaea]